MKIDELTYIKGRRSVGIRISDGRVIVRAPKGIAADKLDAIINSKEAWVNRKLSEFAASVEKHKEIICYREFLYAENIYGNFNVLLKDAAAYCGIDIKSLLRAYGTRNNHERAYRKIAETQLINALNETAAKQNIKIG